MPERRLKRHRRFALAAGLLAVATLALWWNRPPHPPHGHHPRHSRIVAVHGEALELESRDGWRKTVHLGPSTRIHQGPRHQLTPSKLRVGLHIHERDHYDHGVWVVDDLDVSPGQPPEPGAASPDWAGVLASVALTLGLARLVQARRRL